MYRVAIVDDEYESAESLKRCLEEYTGEYGTEFNVSLYKNGAEFLENHPAFDIVFMDIDMPIMNGLEVAKKLRASDSSVALIFVTFLAKYALRGYEYAALDYVLKPVNYNAFKIKIRRAIQNCNERETKSVRLPSNKGEIYLPVNEINYIEVFGHDITYHTSKGEIKAFGTLSLIESLLPAGQFERCNRCYLVNLRNVTRLEKNFVFLGEEKLQISSPRKKEFVNKLHDFYKPV